MPGANDFGFDLLDGREAEVKAGTATLACEGPGDGW